VVRWYQFQLISPSQSCDNLFITHLSLFSSRRLKPIELNTMFKLCVSHLECIERDKKRYQRQKMMSEWHIVLCPPVMNLIKAQVCDNTRCFKEVCLRMLFVYRGQILKKTTQNSKDVHGTLQMKRESRMSHCNHYWPPKYSIMNHTRIRQPTNITNVVVRSWDHEWQPNDHTAHLLHMQLSCLMPVVWILIQSSHRNVQTTWNQLQAIKYIPT
jgi:hypothetical protein